MDIIKEVKLPLCEKDIKELKAGEQVLLTGTVLTARDAAHKKLKELYRNGKTVPVELRGQVIYYAAPAPAPKGRSIGPIGPTSSCRMDIYLETLFSKGLKGTIGKGPRSLEAVKAIRDFGAVYFTATGGAAAYLSGFVREARTVAFPELGPEAMQQLKIEKMPVIVAVDSQGGNIFSEGKREG